MEHTTYDVKLTINGYEVVIPKWCRIVNDSVYIDEYDRVIHAFSNQFTRYVKISCETGDVLCDTEWYRKEVYKNTLPQYDVKTAEVYYDHDNQKVIVDISRDGIHTVTRYHIKLDRNNRPLKIERRFITRKNVPSRYEFEEVEVKDEQRK